MSTTQNLTQTIDQLKRDIQKEVSELAAKESAIKTSELDKTNLLREIQVKEQEMKQKEQEISKLKTEILQMKNKIPEIDRTHRRLADEVTHIRLDHDKKNLEMIKIQGEFQKALKETEKNKK